jgi:hypothetical protein
MAATRYLVGGKSFVGLCHSQFGLFAFLFCVSATQKPSKLYAPEEFEGATLNMCNKKRRKSRVCIYYSDDLADRTVKNNYYLRQEEKDVRKVPVPVPQAERRILEKAFVSRTWTHAYATVDDSNRRVKSLISTDSSFERSCPNGGHAKFFVTAA